MISLICKFISLHICCYAIQFQQFFFIVLWDQLLICRSDEKDLWHSQVVTRSVSSSFKVIDKFQRTTQSTTLTVGATEFGKSIAALKFY